MKPSELPGELPSAETIHAIARQTLVRLPSPFRESLDDIILIVEELAASEIVRALGLHDAMRLTGLYQGIPLNRRSVSESGVLPERITLYRKPILAEWQSSSASLEQIVSHIVIHEVGHHFGFSDDEMRSLEQEGE
jgi:predicted Zn-dependent protease with MMP-like domain